MKRLPHNIKETHSKTLIFKTRTMKAVIVEDETKSRANLQNLLEKYCENVEVVGMAEDIDDAIAMFKNPAIKPDVAFLDINLPNGLIFQVLNHLKNEDDINFDIIFITAYENFMKKACEYACVGYINKPIDPDELKAAVSRVRIGKGNKIKERIEVLQGHQSNSNNLNMFSKIGVSALDGIHFINIKDIVRMEGDNNYTHIFMHSGDKMTVAKTIKSYEELLAGVNFFRVHKKHLINLNFMNRFIKSDNKVLMDDNLKLEVSRRRRPGFMELMKKLQGDMQAAST
jgi:two-component system, LytTR family, response regulator